MESKNVNIGYIFDLSLHVHAEHSNRSEEIVVK